MKRLASYFLLVLMAALLTSQYPAQQLKDSTTDIKKPALQLSTNVQATSLITRDTKIARNIKVAQQASSPEKSSTPDKPLASIIETQQDLKEIQEMLNSIDIDVRKRAINRAFQLAEPEQQIILTKVLGSDPSEEIRANTLERIYQTQPSNIEKWISLGLIDRSESINQQALSLVPYLDQQQQTYLLPFLLQSYYLNKSETIKASLFQEISYHHIEVADALLNGE